MFAKKLIGQTSLLGKAESNDKDVDEIDKIINQEMEKDNVNQTDSGTQAVNDDKRSVDDIVNDIEE